MRDKILAKMDALGQEAHELSNLREQLLNQVSEIETRLTQLVGAIAEFKMLIDEEEQTLTEVKE